MGKGINIGNEHSGNQHKTGRSGLDTGSKQSFDSSPESKKEPGGTDTRQKKGKHGGHQAAGTSGKTAPQKHHER